MRGFGVIICAGCKRTIQGDNTIYRFVECIKSFSKDRSQKKLFSLCYDCAMKIKGEYMKRG